MRLVPIGRIRSPHTRPEDTPVQPQYAAGCAGQVEVLPELAAGLDDIDGFSHIYLIYWLDRVSSVRLRVRPFMDTVDHGIFATRAPWRPNPVGLSLVRLVRREANVLHIEGVDVLDDTPLLDIKPFARRFDCAEDARGGWTDGISDLQARERGRQS